MIATSPLPSDALAFCRAILPQVSRTFAINIRVLGGELQQAVLCAYLYCRVVDTVEDSAALEAQRREQLLEDYARMFAAPVRSAEVIAAWIKQWGELDVADPEQRLIADLGLVEVAFSSLPESARIPVCACVREMALGMLKTIRRPVEQQSGLHHLHTIAELEEYCHFVAGTVGRMLTNLFCHYLTDINETTRDQLLRLDQSFARGLQMTNIIKDARRDFERGWMYLPREMMGAVGIAPDKFFESQNTERSLVVFDQLTCVTAQYLRDALEYTLLIPPQHVSVRLFNLWSLFFAIRTLRRAYRNPCLVTGAKAVKIPRWEVYYTIWQTRRLVCDDTALRRLFERLGNGIFKP